MADIFFRDFVQNDVDPFFRNPKRIGDGIGDVPNELLLLLRSSPWKQTDLYNGHLYLLSIIENNVTLPTAGPEPRVLRQKSLYFDCHSGLDPESSISELDSRRSSPRT